MSIWSEQKKMPANVSQHAPLHPPSAQSPSDPAPLAVRPRAAWIMLGCSNSYGYELLARGELDSFTDGSARKITVESIKR
jgi:hypothetical protein